MLFDTRFRVATLNASLHKNRLRQERGRLKDHLFDTSIEKTLSENSSLVGCVSDDVYFFFFLKTEL